MQGKVIVLTLIPGSPAVINRAFGPFDDEHGATAFAESQTEDYDIVRVENPTTEDVEIC